MADGSKMFKDCTDAYVKGKVQVKHNQLQAWMTERLVLEASNVFRIQWINMMSEIFWHTRNLSVINVMVKVIEWDQS